MCFFKANFLLKVKPHSRQVVLTSLAFCSTFLAVLTLEFSLLRAELFNIEPPAIPFPSKVFFSWYKFLCLDRPPSVLNLQLHKTH